MLSRMNSVLVVVLAVLIMTAGFATVARADTIYVDWKASPTTRVAAYDLGTGTPVAGFAPITGVAQGIDISPLDGFLYAVTTGNKIIKKYDPLTGALIGTFYTTGGTTRGLAFDSAGNLYAALGYSGNNKVAKISPAGVLLATWGDANGASLANFPQDLEVRGDRLYGGIGGPLGIVSWDLATGAYNGSLASMTAHYGFALAPDGTLFTTHATPGEGKHTVRRWSSDYASYTVILDITSPGSYPYDADYWKGSLYVATDKYLYRCSNPFDLTPTWNQFITGSATATSGAGFLAFAIPEPGTLALLGVGLVGLLCYAWRKRK